MRVLALLHEAFGGEGGIAQFNRDFVTAAAGSPAVEEVALLLRRLPAPPGPVPDRVLLHRAGAGGKILYGVAALKAATFGGRIDIVVCRPLRLLRLGPPGARHARAALLLIVDRHDDWPTTRQRPV